MKLVKRDLTRIPKGPKCTTEGRGKDYNKCHYLGREKGNYNYDCHLSGGVVGWDLDKICDAP